MLAYTPGPIVFTQVLSPAGPHKTLASALNLAAFNVGVAGASWIAALTLASPLEYAGSPVMGSAIALRALIPLAMLCLMHRPYAERRGCKRRFL